MPLTAGAEPVTETVALTVTGPATTAFACGAAMHRVNE